ncbi:MAG TPA: PilZ domain-containing protein [Anaerolineales bacterium]|nr:PilZ domain-containing protein [Anaerolineales bacterium]
MQERRKQPRKDLMSYSQVFDLHNGYLLGYLGDLNLLGAMVISDEEMDTGRDLTVQIQLPELEGISASSINLPARIAWCAKDLSPEYFNVGIEFKELTAGQNQIIEAVIENYEFRRQSPNYPQHPNELGGENNPENDQNTVN